MNDQNEFQKIYNDTFKNRGSKTINDFSYFNQDETLSKTIFTDYQSVRNEIMSKHPEELKEICFDFILWLIKHKPKLENENYVNFALFISDLPIITAFDGFISFVDSLKYNTNEFRYITDIHSYLRKNGITDEYSNFYERICEFLDSIETEKR